MELSDPSILELLLAKPERASRLRSRPRTTRLDAGCQPAYEAPAGKSRSRGCRCGICAQCTENARWERIFQEKFADPGYYSRALIRHASPLNAC